MWCVRPFFYYCPNLRFRARAVMENVQFENFLGQLRTCLNSLTLGQDSSGKGSSAVTPASMWRRLRTAFCANNLFWFVICHLSLLYIVNKQKKIERSANWTIHEVKMLIDLMDEFKDQFKKCTNKKELRLKIASRLREEGFTRNEAQIKKKLNIWRHKSSCKYLMDMQLILTNGSICLMLYSIMIKSSQKNNRFKKLDRRKGGNANQKFAYYWGGPYDCPRPTPQCLRWFPQNKGRSNSTIEKDEHHQNHQNNRQTNKFANSWLQLNNVTKHWWMLTLAKYLSME